ncbi:MAG: phosphoethanolamine transferase [Muribaculaceae bacterium]|nr:phosphoethanolamine transferase [Muribaculaceae bacterium]
MSVNSKTHNSKIHNLGRWADTKLLNALTAPFVHTPGLMMVLLVMQVVVPYHMYVHIRPWCIPEGAVAATGILFANSLLFAWLGLLIYNLLRRASKICAGIWITLTLIVFFTNWLIDFGLVTIYNQEFHRGIAAVLLASNFDESCNFIATYLNGSLVQSFLLYIGSFIASYFIGSILVGRYLRRLLSRRGGAVIKTIKYILVIIVAGCVICNITLSVSKMASTNIKGKIVEFASIDSGHPIVPQNPVLNINTEDSPLTIVVIIGESHSSTHSQLYGYDKPNEPRLNKLLEDSTLFVFKSPIASELHTIECLEHMVGTYNGESDKNWYECLTFLEVANKAGYTTTWLSNQSAKGFHENPITKIAQYCNSIEFTNDGMHKRTEFDEELFPIIDKHLNKDNRTLTVIHLQGSHIDYTQRSPENFKRFKPDDYELSTDKQKEVISAYDNSILYNDYVVSTIMNKYRDADAVVIYLSDHGQDLFQSSPDFFGHAKPNNKRSAEAALAVPFYVYLSPMFKQKHPAVTNRIENSTDNPPHLTNLIYTLMDLMGCSFPDNNDVAQKTFFRPL